METTKGGLIVVVLLAVVAIVMFMLANNVTCPEGQLIDVDSSFNQMSIVCVPTEIPAPGSLAPTAEPLPVVPTPNP